MLMPLSHKSRKVTRAQCQQQQQVTAPQLARHPAPLPPLLLLLQRPPLLQARARQLLTALRRRTVGV
jgi:hypothetical protein